MRLWNGTLLFSASDLVNFLGCTHATALDLRQLFEPLELPADGPHLILLQDKGIEHERAYLETLRARGLAIIEIDSDEPVKRRTALTRTAMARGVDVIYQGALLAPPWHGFSDFLLRVDGEDSCFGPFGYEVADTKLSRSAKPEHALQLCVYSALVGRMQGRAPRRMHVVLGDGGEVSLPVADFLHYCEVAQRRLEAFVASPPAASTGEPCAHCETCRWSGRCADEWDAGDHLSLVANISRTQTRKLREAGVATLRDLARLPRGARIPGIQPRTLLRLGAQARLQEGKRDDGGNRLETLPPEPGRGFARLPRPDYGDLYFDMEGDPHFEDGGLEYLFGFVHREPGGAVHFTPFWAHDRAGEKLAFEAAVDFIIARLEARPGAHVYHYAAYEQSALKRLAMFHGTREAEVDDLLRHGKLVDLYKVVREAIRVSEPRYSIKNLEAFYGVGRADGVKTAGDSIVVYERWRRLGDPTLLREIADYNEVDCRSTLMCHGWLLGLRPASGVEWFVSKPYAGDPDKREERWAAEARTADLTAVLIDAASPAERSWRGLLGRLLEFHRREAKPEWWAMFARREMGEDELVDDAECIGALERDPDRLPYSDKKSTVHTYRFPAQDFKMRPRDEPVRPGTLEPVGEIVALDENELRIALRVGPSRTPLPDRLSLIPKGPLGDQVLRGAIYRYAEAVAAGDACLYPAVTSILRRAAPRLRGRAPGAPILSPGADPATGAVDALHRLADGYLLIQGPPGAGKTYTSAHAIVGLIAEGRRVGVASNAHKAVNNLLAAVEKIAAERGVVFRGIKKSSDKSQYLGSGGSIADTINNGAVETGDHQLIAGTAWLFAREALDRTLDYLFVDEAGQVSLANVVAMGLSACNIVLVGDQMQLAQPVRGTHPGGSGLSVLEHLLGGDATVPPDRGVFLAVTRRMHPDLCRFVSGAFYNGRLEAEAGNARQRLVLHRDCDREALAPAGLRFVAVLHEGRAQHSEEEAARLATTYGSLLRQRWIDRDGAERALRVGDILVVSPYNMQVDLLRRRLPAGARVGTVDRFQGQEAPVVLISMATSSGDDLPRDIGFLHSRNRLNVAVSRARCLAVVFASPRLLEVACRTIVEMRLVNTLCRVRCYADSIDL